MANQQPESATQSVISRVNLWRRASPGNDDQGDGLLTDQDDQIEADNQDSATVKYTSQIAALFIIVNVTVGVGLLAIPAAMQDAGLVTSIMVQIVFLAIIITTCIICTELTCQTDVDSYHKFIQFHCHPYIYQITQVSILLLVFGTSVAYIVLIGDQADRIFASLYGPTFCQHWYMDRKFIMAFLTVFVIKPLCAAKTVDFLKYGSFLGIASVGFIIYVVVSEFSKISRIPDTVNYLPKTFVDIGTVMPVFCFAYQCHLSWVPIVASIRKDEKRKAYITISIGMLIATVIYALVSILAVLTFGSAIESDLTQNYPGKTWPVLTTIGIVAFKCVVTLPSAFLPARLSIVDIMSGSFKWFADLSEPIRRMSATYLTLSLALLLALYVPDILVAVNILGCLAVMFVFTLPALCYLNHITHMRIKKQLSAGEGDIPIYSAKDKMKRALSYSIAAFGFLMMALVLYKSIMDMINKHPGEPLCQIPK